MVCFLAVPLYAIGSLSDNLTVPHTFSSGETISSNKMNENFNRIFEELNKLRKYIFSNGNIVAEFLSFKDNFAVGINHKGYLLEIDYLEGTYVQLPNNTTYLWFETTNCTGDMYVYGLKPNQIFNFEYNSLETYYTGSNYYTFAFKSYELNGNCSDQSNNVFEMPFVKIYGNNSSITGVNSTSLPIPITINSK